MGCQYVVQAYLFEKKDKTQEISEDILPSLFSDKEDYIVAYGMYEDNGVEYLTYLDTKDIADIEKQFNVSFKEIQFSTNFRARFEDSKRLDCFFKNNQVVWNGEFVEWDF